MSVAGHQAEGETTMGGIVVGVDGSADADAALRWSMAEAQRRTGPLVVLLAWDPRHCPPAVTGMANVADELGTAPDDHDTEAAAYRVLHTAIRRATDRQRPSAVVERVERGDAAQLLLTAAADKDMLVLGLHGANRKHRLLAGSVTDRCLQRAWVTTVVVRAGQSRPHGPVVVGVDGSVSSLQALRQAAAQARSRHATLRVVHAWMPIPLMSPGSFGGVDVTTFEKAASALLDDCLDQAHEDLAGLRGEPVLVEDAAAHALIQQSGDASLLVVGSRGHGGFTSLTLGSVSHQCVHHAACPVAVVRSGG